MEFAYSTLLILLVLALVSEISSWTIFFIDWKAKRKYRNNQSLDRSDRGVDAGEDQGCSPLS